MFITREGVWWKVWNAKRSVHHRELCVAVRLFRMDNPLDYYATRR